MTILCSVQSTLVPGARAELTKSLAAAKIIEGYWRSFGIDVSTYFQSDEVPIYECQATNYCFFHPASLMGREDLYQQLQAEKFFYKLDKWEYRESLKFIPRGSQILDVGCGFGHFLKIATEAGHSASGLELNSAATRAARSAGLEVFSETVEAYADNHKDLYDIVSSFQVLEHIYDVHSFIYNCTRVLKSGGHLIFGVPNNAGFLRFDQNAILNCPPHHMGLWTPRSLSKLPYVFPIELVSINIEPIAEIDWYCSVRERQWLPDNPIARALYYRIGLSRAFRTLVRLNSKRIAGHTVLAIYKKL